MISDHDLRAAVNSGLLNEAQAASLTALSHSRKGARENLAIGDEPFELFRGFNEIFIVVGLLILAGGWAAVVTAMIASDAIGLQGQIASASLISAGVVWALGEYFIRRRRMVAPAIALSILFSACAVIGLSSYFSEPFMVAQQDLSSLPFPLGLSLVALGIFWLRFRVPFAMALLALGAYALSLILTADQNGGPIEISELFLLSADGHFAWITLAIGVAVFALAMVFDTSDPHRVTRRSSQGFWLHIVAAPMLVNTLALTLLEQEGAGARYALLAVMLGFALVAIVIDRRSFLIAAIGYLVALASLLFESAGAAWTILVLGAVLLALGAFWAPIRAALLSSVFAWLPQHKLPPSHTQGSL